MTGPSHELIDRHEAITAVLDRRLTVAEYRSAETVAIDAVNGRTLARDIVADRDVPAADTATMDGYALDATDPYPLALLDDEIAAETTPPHLPAGHAVAIATGGRLPEGANAVLKQEEAVVEAGQLRGAELDVGTYTYERGSNVAAGEILFERYERLSPKDAIFLRDLGHEAVEVLEPLSVAVLATGTEIHEGEWDDLDTPMLVGLLRSWGHEATAAGTVPDDEEQVIAAIESLADEHDVVVTTGGTSVGRHDYVIDALLELGSVDFHRVRLRPGKPIAMASLDDATTAFAIPGKPVGAHTISTLVMRPFFTGSAALPTLEATWPIDLDIGDPEFEYAIPVTLDGEHAHPLGHVDSPLAIYSDRYDPSVLSSSTRATRADGFVLTDSALTAGSKVGVVPYPVVE